MKRGHIAIGLMLVAIGATAFRLAAFSSPAVLPVSPTPVADWSLEAQRAIVPPPAGVGDKFPGEAAVYMGIVHAAMYDVALAIHGGYRPYAIGLTPAADTAPAAAIAAAAHGVLIGLLPTQIADLNRRYAEYLAALPNDAAKVNGVALGEKAAAAMLAMRTNDGRTAEIQAVPPRSGAGLFAADPTRPTLGLRLSRMRPLALESPQQFRPGAPAGLGTGEYAADLEEVRSVGWLDSDVRSAEQTNRALFWMDHDVRQWNDGLLRLAADRGLDLMQAARTLALAHVSGGDAMIACFDAKYHYMYWRPAAATLSGPHGRRGTGPGATWRPLRPAPNHPEYPAAHSCHTGAIVEALRTVFGIEDVPVTLDSRTTGTTHTFKTLEEIVRGVEDARVFSGFHFRNSTRIGSRLGRDVARYIAGSRFRRAADSGPNGRN